MTTNGKAARDTVIVTGAAHGIGAAVVARCLRDGMRVLALDSDAKGLDDLRQNHHDAAAVLEVHTVDVAEYDQVAKVFSLVSPSELGLTHLVNNAGVYLAKRLAHYTAVEMSRVFAVNILGAAFCSQLFANRLLPRHGTIVNVSSVAGRAGSEDAIYGSSKAALLGLTISCAKDFAPYIRVNAVAPGLVTTTMLKQVPEHVVTEYRGLELLRSPIEPDDVAATVAFLMSSQSLHYTGSIFDINNGVSRFL